MESVDFVVDKKNFNLNVKLSNNSTESFTGISKSEYNKLYSYIQLREIKITGKKQDIVEESIEDSEDKEEEKVEENISRSSRLGKREARKKNARRIQKPPQRIRRRRRRRRLEHRQRR